MKKKEEEWRYLPQGQAPTMSRWFPRGGIAGGTLRERMDLEMVSKCQGGDNAMRRHALAIKRAGGHRAQSAEQDAAQLRNGGAQRGIIRKQTTDGARESDGKGMKSGTHRVTQNPSEAKGRTAVVSPAVDENQGPP